MFERQPVVALNERIIKQLQVCGLDEADICRMGHHALARELFRLRHLTVGLAAELAGVSRSDFLAELAGQGIAMSDLPAADADKEFATVEGMMRSQ